MEARMEEKKSVRFHTVTIRNYDLTIGDNPWCSCGAPVSIDWTYQSEINLPLEAYEQHHPPRRKGSELAMPHRLREELLTDTANIPFSQIIKASRQNEKDQSERSRSMKRFRRQEFYSNLRSFGWLGKGDGSSKSSSKPRSRSKSKRRDKQPQLSSNSSQTSQVNHRVESSSIQSTFMSTQPLSLDLSHHPTNFLSTPESSDDESLSS